MYKLAVWHEGHVCVYIDHFLTEAMGAVALAKENKIP